MPATTDDMIHIAALPDTRAQGGRRTWLPHELFVEGMDLVDHAGELRTSLLDVFWLPIFVAGMRAFTLLPEQMHTPRVTVGRSVFGRETWNIAPADVLGEGSTLSAFARQCGMPRRVFAKSPLERKPMYVDVESPALSRILRRHARHLSAKAPEKRIRFTEMLPTPDECWLADPDGNRYASELRIVAVQTRPNEASNIA